MNSAKPYSHPAYDQASYEATRLRQRKPSLTAPSHLNTKEDPGVARIRVAITDLVPVRLAMNTLTTWVPQMRLMSGVVGTATGSNFFVGQIGIEAEFIDAESNERLAAMASKQAGKKYILLTGRTARTASKWGQVENDQ